MEEIQIQPLRPEIGQISLEEIERIVLETGRIDIRVVSRKRNYVLHRGIFFMLAVAYTRHSLASIGLHLGKDHATVIHANKTTPWTLAQDKDAKNMFRAIHARVRHKIDTRLKEIDFIKDNRVDSATDYMNVYDRVDRLLIEVEHLKTQLAKEITVEYDTAI